MCAARRTINLLTATDYYISTDIDECSMGSDNCRTDAQCTNNNGSFTCTCNDGYTGNGVTCTGIQPPG